MARKMMLIPEDMMTSMQKKPKTRDEFDEQQPKYSKLVSLEQNMQDILNDPYMPSDIKAKWIVQFQDQFDNFKQQFRLTSPATTIAAATSALATAAGAVLPKKQPMTTSYGHMLMPSSDSVAIPSTASGFAKNLLNAAQGSSFQPNTEDPVHVISPVELESAILSTIPKKLRSNAATLITSLKTDPRFGLNEKGEIEIDGKIIPNSNFLDLINYTTRKLKHQTLPEGWNAYGDLLRDMNIKQKFVGNQDLWNYISRSHALHGAEGGYSSPSPSRRRSHRKTPSQYRKPGNQQKGKGGTWESY